MQIDPYELAIALAGVAALVAAWLPAYTANRPLSLPIVLVVVGVVLFAVPLGFAPPDPRDHLGLVERLTELTVIVALMGAGLKIDRPFSWRTWSSTWRMLIIAMPLTIVLTAVIGAAVGGLAPVAALLLGAVLAPTDPVLASDVQVGEPTLVADEDGEAPPDPYNEDEVRFTLTSEGGFNDALAFPFVYAAIAIAENGWGSTAWVPSWIAWDLVGRIAVGLAVGWLTGRLVGVVSFRPPGPLTALAEAPQGFLAIAATFIAYGATELVSGYGFVAVFVAALGLRSSERHHQFHADLHSFAEQVENVLVVGMLLLLGGALVSGVLDGLTWGGAAVAVAVVLVVRPLAGTIALARSSLPAVERRAIAFFGIRGFGSVYYLAYALGIVAFPDAAALWAIVALTLVISIATHGITATPVMNLIDRTREPNRWRRPLRNRRPVPPDVARP